MSASSVKAKEHWDINAVEAAASHRASAASALQGAGNDDERGFAGQTFLSSLPLPNSEPMEPKKPFFCSVRYPIEIPGEISRAALDLCRSPARKLPWVGSGHNLGSTYRWNTTMS